MSSYPTGATRPETFLAEGWSSARGIERLGDPRVSGSVIGAVGGSVFVLANRGALSRPWPVVVLAVWAIALALYLWSAFFAVRLFPPLPGPRRGAGLVYVAGVLGMLGLMVVGSQLLRVQGRVELQAAVVVLAVGLHFLPFSWAFRAPVFALLGSLLAGLGVAGLVLGWAWDPTAPSVVAVLAGLGMLAVLVAYAVQPAHPSR